jgi:hypothetical protein
VADELLMPNDVPTEYPDALVCHPEFLLRTNPFAPLGPDGMRFDYAAGALNPTENERHLKYYFDFYEWIDKDSINSLAETGRIKHIQWPNPDKPIVILISGSAGCGRSSLQNLLVYELEKRSKVKPIITLFPKSLLTQNQTQNALNLSDRFVKTLKRQSDMSSKSAAQAAEEEVEGWRKNLIGDVENTEYLFSNLKVVVSDNLPNKLIICCLDASDHKISLGIWRPACIMLSQIANFIIVLLSDRSHADWFKENLVKREFQVVWVDVPVVTDAKMVQFLAKRLNEERPDVPGKSVKDPLLPFTHAAVSKVFASGTKVPGENPVPLSIRTALQHLGGVYSMKCDDLLSALPAPGGNLEVFQKVIITPADVKRYFDKHFPN